MTFQQSLYCPIRKTWIAALPEELVRQRVINHMIEEQGFPASLIAVEQAVRKFPHLSVTDRRLVPDRRADVVCFAKGLTGMNDLYPLLTIECKAVKLTPRVISQVLGYNHFIRACFIAVANQAEIRTGWYHPDKGEYVFVELPPFLRGALRLGSA